ncbi:PepSY-associated TM helix domain-containing protein [Phenylobacterium sp.]|uniref:PepSY-associated TM helix domain-containing protein n=1 Tax=Phenylobacterium sp. TaxID=1871053 RepID=UPI00286B1EB1|nr:PepSY-associated TM helix domain-containing protein [Phenylobacterium sp.]
MRKIHRWISVGAALFLLIVASTGVILQAQKLLGGDEKDQDRRRVVPGAMTTSSDAATYGALLSKTLEAARARAPRKPIASVELRFAQDEPRGIVTLPGDPGRRITVDPRDGKVVTDETFEGDSIFLRIHSGEILGEPGVVLGLLWGLALVVLSVTGGWMYLHMYRKRRKARGKGQAFW